MGSDPQSHLEEQTFLDVDGQKIGVDDWRKAMQQAAGLIEDINLLRKLLWYRHGCLSPALYGDDGELQCNKCGIDFRRDPAQKIDSRFFELYHASMTQKESILVNGLVAMRNKQPYVELMIGGHRAQLTMPEARQVANDIIGMAARTEADAMIVKFFEREAFPPEAASLLMVAFRDFRHQLDQDKAERTDAG